MVQLHYIAHLHAVQILFTIATSANGSTLVTQPMASTSVTNLGTTATISLTTRTAENTYISATTVTTVRNITVNMNTAVTMQLSALVTVLPVTISYNFSGNKKLLHVCELNSVSRLMHV